MTGFRQIPQRDCDRLKAACAEAVDHPAVGGVRRAAEHLQLSPGRVSQSASPFEGARWFSLLHVAELEALAGAPIIARALADLADCDVVPRGAGARDTVHHHLARITRECADVQSLLLDALSDGQISDAERDAVVREARQAVDALNALAAALLGTGGDLTEGT